jgi:hypothetical protein
LPVKTLAVGVEVVKLSENWSYTKNDAKHETKTIKHSLNKSLRGISSFCVIFNSANLKIKKQIAIIIDKLKLFSIKKL